jgi:hypothetical protein
MLWGPGAAAMDRSGTSIYYLEGRTGLLHGHKQDRGPGGRINTDSTQN